MTIEIVDNADQGRYEAHIDGELAGVVDYEREEEYTVFPHTEVSPRHRGEGIASLLVTQAMEDLRANGEKAYPLCPYVKSWFDDHPEYADVLYRPG